MAAIHSADGPACVPPPPEAGVADKYIPPQKRHAMASAAAGGQDSAPANSYRSSPNYPQGSDRDGARRGDWGGRAGGARGGGQFRDGGRGGFSRPASSAAGSNRWDCFTQGDDFESSAGGRYSQGGRGGASAGASGGRVRSSATGTGWDVRDGRLWMREDEKEVFKGESDQRTGVNFDSYESIPVEMSGQGAQALQPIGTFQEAKGVHPIVAENIIRVKYNRPTPVQKYAIPAIFAGRDVMACAQTGSGKTAAFLFPVITKMLSEGPPETPAPSRAYRLKQPAFPVALVLSPTRELAIQTFEVSRKFAFNSGIRTVVLYGGAHIRNQMVELERGCDICVATPGRLEDLMDREKLLLKCVKYLVLDEADRMLDMGFEPKIRQIVLQSDMPSSKEGRQTVMFSATFPREIQQLASHFLDSYVFITVGRIGSTNDFIEQEIIYVQDEHKNKRLIQLLGDSPEGLTLIFVETKRRADMVENFLLDHNFHATSIHGDRDQSEREYALKHFRSGRCPILVATDVAARGLDIPNITLVINLDLPGNIDDYVHRIGRTGRAGNQGKATSLINEKNSGVLRDLHGLLEEAGQAVPDWFTDMVRSCTSASKHFQKFSGGGNWRGNRGGAGFGGRDIRQEERSFHREGFGGGRSRGGGGMDRGPRDTGGGDMRRAGGGGHFGGGGGNEDDGW